MNNVWMPTTQKNHLTTHQISELKSLIDAHVEAEICLSDAYNNGWGDTVMNGERESKDAEATLNKYLDSLLEKK